MTAPLSNVQWLSIQEAADLWQAHLSVPKELIIRELRLGWYKWTKEKEGVSGFRCGVPLESLPPEADLPSPDQLIDREFLHQFAIKQAWRIPDGWRRAPVGEAGRYPGRPSVRPAILQKLEELADKGQLRDSLARQAAELHRWASKEFFREQVPSEGTIENQIRDRFRILKSTRG